MKNKQSYGFQVKFDSSSPSINTDTYIQALISLTNIIKEENYQLGGKEKISIDITAQEQGSFKVDMLLKATESIFGKDSIEYLSGIANILVGIITLKKIHKKTNPEKTEINGDDVVIKNNKGDVLYQTNKNTYNIYCNNQIVQDAIADKFTALEKDSEINGLEINCDKNTVRVGKKEFPELAERLEIQVKDAEIDIIPANLVIVKLVFEGKNRKWDFLYNGVKISAVILDEKFWSKIDHGKPFSKGDVLVADLKIIREYDNNIAAYVNKDYQVVDVREHRPREFRQQISMDNHHTKD